MLDLLPASAAGASGWMVAIANDEGGARDALVHEVQQSGFEEIDVEQVQPIEVDDIVDERLQQNVWCMEPGSRCRVAAMRPVFYTSRRF